MSLGETQRSGDVFNSGSHYRLPWNTQSIQELHEWGGKENPILIQLRYFGWYQRTPYPWRSIYQPLFVFQAAWPALWRWFSPTDAINSYSSTLLGDSLVRWWDWAAALSTSRPICAARLVADNHLKQCHSNVCTYWCRTMKAWKIKTSCSRTSIAKRGGR